MIKLAITGCTGRMGQMLLLEANDNPEIEVVGALTRPGSLFIGQDLGNVVGENPMNIAITDIPMEAFKDADVVIDFSKPEALKKTLEAVLHKKIPYIVCMTGLNIEQKIALEDASQNIPLIIAPNTSLGIALLRKLAVISAEILGPSYDISISEMHHREKKDAPSGTSLFIASALTAIEHLKANKPPYPSLSPRPLGHIECAVIRGGSSVGDHSVFFAGEKELIKLEHRATDRGLFAQGAIRAAQWLYDKPAGLYSMDDVVGIS
ncbi:MAG: 4-hydroxy-tetrahydrodipicolinate reductase [Alphaproteobacteria bacterium]|nr:4-hydroxy-tetrahydrodipicolinate reductase [Alphaproteobacteria bacterium]